MSVPAICFPSSFHKFVDCFSHETGSSARGKWQVRDQEGFRMVQPRRRRCD